MGSGRRGAHNAAVSTTTAAAESATGATRRSASSSLSSSSSSTPSSSSPSSSRRQRSARVGRMATLGLLLASASTLVYQGVRHRSVLSGSTRMTKEEEEEGGGGWLVGLRNPSSSAAVPSAHRASLIAPPAKNATASFSSSSAMATAATGLSFSDDPSWLDMADFYVYLDAFSDSWYMGTATFLEAKHKIDEIDSVEEACFLMFDGREDRVRMSLDWLDLSVEHMSKWWRTVGAPRRQYANGRAIEHLRRYALNSFRDVADYEPHRALLRPTVALVAFQEYAEPGSRGDEDLKQRCRELTVASLAATISSLVKVGMGRVVVVGHEKERGSEAPQVMEAFDLLVAAQENVESGEGAMTMANERVVLGSQLAYVTVPTDMVRTDFVPANLPRGALLGLHRAFSGGDETWTREWLGHESLDPSTPPQALYKFVYLTEPDTLLHTRPRTVPTLAKMLREGCVLAPHRLQPIPYESDFPNSTLRHTFVGEEHLLSSPFPTITALDASTDACCDEQRGAYRPGSHDAVGSNCGQFWWQCGFGDADEDTDEDPRVGNHSRILDHYRLVRLHQGTGVTTLAGTEHGRRCLPVVNGVCQRKARDLTKVVRRPRNPWVTPNKKKQRRIAQLARELNATGKLRDPEIRS